MFNQVVLVALFCLVGFSLAVEITDCSKSDTVGKLIKAEVSNCTSEDAACILKRGAKANIAIEFESYSEVSKLKHSVHGIIRKVPIPFKLPNEDACVDTGLTCPLTVGKHRYEYELYVKPVYPTIPHLEVKWQLTDAESGKDVVCLEIPAQVK